MLHFSVVALSLLLAPAADKKTKEEIKKLKGTWRITSAEAQGKAIKLKDLGMDRVIITADKMTFKSRGKEVKVWAYAVDPSKKPKEMDWNNPGARAPHPAIYELKGDTLKVCFPILPIGTDKPAPEVTRPKAFITKGGQFMMFIARRQKE